MCEKYSSVNGAIRLRFLRESQKAPQGAMAQWLREAAIPLTQHSEIKGEMGGCGE